MPNITYRKVKVDGVDYIILRTDDVLAVLEPEHAMAK